MRVFELLVDVLTAALTRYDEDEYDPEVLFYLDKCSTLYRQYRSTMDFTSAARRAKVETVEEILAANNPLT